MILYMSETICRLIAHFVHAQNHTFHFNSNSQILKFKFISYHHHIKYIQSLTIMQTSLGSASLEKKKIVANLFFPGVIDPGTNKYNRIVKTWTCSACPSRKDPIWADLSHGCHNLINHIQSRHGHGEYILMVVLLLLSFSSLSDFPSGLSA